MKNALAHRRAVKKKKPNFIRQDAHKKVKVSNNWRKPKGSDSKMRVSRKGYHRCVRVGWGSPNSIKGFTREGLEPVVVACKKDIESIDSKSQCIIIQASVGTKKRLDLIVFAKEKDIKIENIKDVDAYVALQQKKIDSKKKSSANKKKSRSAEKEKAKKEADKKAKKEEKSDKANEDSEKKSAAKSKAEDKTQTVVSDEKSQEKKEQEKVLIKRK